MSLPPLMHRRAQLLVSEYAGALPPGHVIAVAVTTALAVRRRSGRSGGTGDDVVEHWEARVRRHLSADVADDLARSALCAARA